MINNNSQLKFTSNSSKISFKRSILFVEFLKCEDNLKTIASISIERLSALFLAALWRTWAGQPTAIKFFFNSFILKKTFLSPAWFGPPKLVAMLSPQKATKDSIFNLCLWRILSIQSNILKFICYKKIKISYFRSSFPAQFFQIQQFHLNSLLGMKKSQNEREQFGCFVVGWICRNWKWIFW